MDVQVDLSRTTALIRAASASLAEDNARAEFEEAQRAEHAALIAAAAAAQHDREASARDSADPSPMGLHIALRAHGRFLLSLEVVHAANQRRITAEAALAAAKRNPDYQ